MQVTVLPHEITGDTIRFRWEQDRPNPWLARNEWTIRYEGLDLSRYTSTLWNEILFAVESRIWGLYGEEVHVTFPTPIPQPSVDYWLARRGLASRIHVTPAAEFSYTPWSAGPAPIGARRIGILFGGGKDSLLTAAMAHELYGSGDLLAIRWVLPYHDGQSNATRIEARDEATMLAPLERSLGIPASRIWSDRRAIINKQHWNGAATHLELLVTGALPLALAWELETITFSYSWALFHVSRQPDGSWDGPMRNSRPESLRLESRHLREIAGIPLAISNPHVLFASQPTFTMFGERYPSLMGNITTCSQPSRTGQHCGICIKCLNLLVGSLAAGVPCPTMDYDAILTRDVFWESLLGPNPEAEPRDRFGNVPIQPKYGHHGYAMQLQEAVANIDPSLVADRLSPRARARLDQLVRVWGNTPMPELHAIPDHLAQANADEITAGFLRIASQHLPVVDRIMPPYLVGRDDQLFDHTVRLRPWTADVPHLRDANGGLAP